MAPKKGGSSGSSFSGSSGSVSCNYCTETLLLTGSDWRDKRIDAMFAIEIIVMVALIGCLILATRFRWTRQRGTDKLRHFGYFLATISTFIFYLFNIIDIGLSESVTKTIYLYTLTYIFSYLFFALSELLILGIILRTLCESTGSHKVHKMNGFHIAVIILLALLITAAFGLRITEIAYTLIYGYGYVYGNYVPYFIERGYVQLAYQALYFVVSIYAGLLSLFLAAKERTKVHGMPGRL
ncbi:hypothetical protein BGZ60DRAFT_154685 [Tricladium varicosporioides]|nr:hypothetical protein BGZ60DRAFT_154685 [Hymenoscyphus varicosporioides]